MKSFMRVALLGAAGLVALSLSAQAAVTTTITDNPAAANDTAQMQFARGPGVHGFRSENPGGAGFKKKKSKKK